VPPYWIEPESLDGTRPVFGLFFFNHLTVAMFVGLGLLFLVLLLRILLRRDWAALAAAWLLFNLIHLAEVYSLVPDLIYNALSWGLLLFVLARFGLLATVASILFSGLMSRHPITSDFSAWYAEGCFFAVGVSALLALFGLYTSLGGEPLFRTRLLDE
jgi:hypothetical protein